MTRYGPDYGDDPRRETDDITQEGVMVPDEYQRRIDRAGRDAVRVAMGDQPIWSTEDALILETQRAREIAIAIRNSADDPTVKVAARRLINLALMNDQITIKDEESLLAYLDALNPISRRDGYDDADISERQAGDY